MTEPTSPSFPMRPDGTLHPVYIAQVKAEWQAARDHLVWAASAGRAAQKAWDEAVERELTTHRRMREVLEAAGEELS